MASIAFLTLLGITGCAGSLDAPQTPGLTGRGLVAAGSDLQSRLLLGLDRLRGAGQVPGVSPAVSSSLPYHAASGRVCRRLTMSTTSEGVHALLACRGAQGWAYSPRVRPRTGQKDGSP